MSLVVKGNAYSFKINFPEVPGGSFPGFVMYTPTGTIFLAGTGVAITGSAGWFEYEVTIPVSAATGTASSPWKITWAYGSIYKTMYFEVTDPNLFDDEIYQKESSKLGLAGSNFDARIIVPETVTDATVTLLTGSGEVEGAGGTASPVTHRLGTQISKTITGDYLTAGEYTLLWDTDVTQYFQRLLVAPPSLLPMILEVRFLIDRIVKQLEEPQAYTESDMYSAIIGGLGIINGWFPLTSWTVLNTPRELKPFLVMAGAWYALNSQFMVETDMAFSYAGQTITLDYDRTGLIAEEAGRLWDYLTEHLTKAKLQVLRIPGMLGVTSGPIHKIGSVTKNRNFRGMLVQ